MVLSGVTLGSAKYPFVRFQRKWRCGNIQRTHLKNDKQEMSLKKTNGVGLKKEENITQARLSTCT